MKARMERAELAIQNQRKRQAKEKAKAEAAAAAASGEDDGGGKVSLSSPTCFSLVVPHLVPTAKCQ
jgi:hypothetical protein